MKLEDFIKAKYPQIYQEYINSISVDKYGTFKETVEFVKKLVQKANPDIGCDEFDMDTGNAKVTFSQHGQVLFTLVKTCTNMGRLDWYPSLFCGNNEKGKVNYTVSHKTMATTVKKICEYVKTHKPKLNIERMMHDLKYEFIDDSKNLQEHEFGDVIFDNIEGASIHTKKGGYPGCNMSFDEFAKERNVTAEQLADKYMAAMTETKIGEYDGNGLSNIVLNMQDSGIYEWIGWRREHAYSREDFIEFFKRCWYDA